MSSHPKSLQKVHFFKNEGGQDLAEYALLIALIALVVIAAVIVFGTQIAAFFTQFITLFP
jgi:Flp pilus assembly pilin Flp